MSESESNKLGLKVIIAEGNLSLGEGTLVSIFTREDCVRLSSCLRVELRSTLCLYDTSPVMVSSVIHPFSIVTEQELTAIMASMNSPKFCS